MPDAPPTSSKTESGNAEEALNIEQFRLQASAFAQSQQLHSQTALAVLLDAGDPQPSDDMLDVACGPGSVVAAFAARVRSATGVDLTDAMLDKANALAGERKLTNVHWRRASAYALPFEDASFDIVISRFAMHHMAKPEAAFAEMLRVARAGARIVLCDAIAADDCAKAMALNEMEKLRDPSTVQIRSASFFENLFQERGLGAPTQRRYAHLTSMAALLKNSFPADREKLTKLLEASADEDCLGLNAQREGNDIHFSCPVAVFFTRIKATQERHGETICLGVRP